MKRIGMLYPSSGISELEIQKMLPEGVSLHITRIPMKEATYKELMHMADCVEEAASLVADARVDIIAFNCTMGSLIKGKGYDEEIMERIGQATGLPATTTTTAVVMGMRTLGMKKLILVTPYVEQMNEIEKTFLEDIGFQVLSYQGLGLDDASKQYGVEPSRWYHLVMEMQEPQADGYLISCAGIRVVDIIGQMEMALGKPVVTSNQALVWHCLRKMGMQEPMEGFGRLLETSLKA